MSFFGWTGRVLLIEDDAKWAHLVGYWLDAAGLEVEHQMTLTEGLDSLRRAKPGCVILDMTLPDVSPAGATSGEALHRLRAVSLTVPVVVSTSHKNVDPMVGVNLAQEWLPKNEATVETMVTAIRTAAAYSAGALAAIEAVRRMEIDP